MAGTRSSSRIAANSSSPQSSHNSNNKRKADSSPASTKSKKGKKTDAKEQKTLEETMPGNEAEQDQPQDIEMKEASNGGEGAEAKPDSNAEHASADTKEGAANGDHASANGNDNGNGTGNKIEDAKRNTNDIQEPGESFKGENKEGEAKSDPEKALKDSRGGAGLNALDVTPGAKADVEEPETHATEASAPHAANPEEKQSEGGIGERQKRADAQPSNILEKGLIYFFTRDRVSVDEAESVQDLQRSYFVLRPIPQGARIGDGPIKDMENNRLFALPKKVWPKSGADKFMVFVEKANATMDDLKENFFSGSEYSTQTTGTRQQHPVTPLGEGVYAITATGQGRESHLAYMLTIPKEPGQVQEDVGIRSKGSFVMSLKNPESKSPANAALPQTAAFPEEFIKEFRGRGWMPAEPKHLKYDNAQVLLIGEDLDSSAALDATKQDKEDDSKVTPAQELEALDGENEFRVTNLRGDDSVFEDLGISHKEYSSVPTTW